MRASRGLKWENKMYKLKRSIGEALHSHRRGRGSSPVLVRIFHAFHVTTQVALKRKRFEDHTQQTSFLFCQPYSKLSMLSGTNEFVRTDLFSKSTLMNFFETTLSII